MSEHKNTATLLVEIAEELYVFGCASEQRGHVAGNPGDDRVAAHVVQNCTGLYAVQLCRRIH